LLKEQALVIVSATFANILSASEIKNGSATELNFRSVEDYVYMLKITYL